MQTIQTSPGVKFLLAFIAICGWFALIAQFFISINSGLAAPYLIVLRYFAYFTLTTNLLVATVCTSLLFNLSDFLSRQKTLAATAVYIMVVGIIYNVILRFIWQPAGLQLVVNELLHAVIPGLFLIYWLFFVPKDVLKWNSIWPWLIYPVIYTAYIFVFGGLTGFYPYPFIDLIKLGLEKTIVNALGVTFAFIIISLLFVWIGKLADRKKNQKSL